MSAEIVAVVPGGRGSRTAMTEPLPIEEESEGTHHWGYSRFGRSQDGLRGHLQGYPISTNTHVRDLSYIYFVTRMMVVAWFNCQIPEDGSWPTFTGVPADEEHLRKARSYYLRSGGAVYLPCWAKFWLALLGLYDWEGIDPYPVEMWLLRE
ncbi:hypothetical protein ETB97_005379 [Aspergillus alliaceus]|uniref:Squalene cyclase N-terminal domain-containing protein n=1 Tax=Petromyces alliaceus TaxID=209559 RepID=A0A8H6E391_PETAA|nr:hypothetical protein ETB97_005379 [Aspergillus burnettii]